MNNRQKDVQKAFLKREQQTLNELNAIYKQAQVDIEAKIQQLMNRTDIENIQSIIYQVEYQKAIKKQIDAALDNLNSNQFKTVADYLTDCYKDGYIGTMYDIAGQGIPFIIPLDQEAIFRAVQLDSKISDGLYDHLGENISKLKKDIASEISRGISTGLSYENVAKHITQNMIGSYTNSKGAYAYASRIARTEGHRIQVQSVFDAQHHAKECGANIVKQWDAALDARTRDSHQAVDGQIKELDEKFSNGLMFPGDPHGKAAEVVNCRCALLQRARWALDERELHTLKERAAYFDDLDKSKSFREYKAKYIKATKVKEVQKDVTSEKLKEKEFTTFTAKQLDAMSMDELRETAKKAAIEYYSSDKTGISFNGASVEEVAEKLVGLGSKTSLKKDILSINKKLKNINK